MKKSLMLLLLFAAILLNSCKKDKQSQKEDDKPALIKLLTRYWGSVNYVGGSGLREENIIFIYDDQNRLIQMKNGLQTTDYIYKDDLLTKINFAYGNGFILESEISYLGSKPKSSKETLFSAPDVIKSETVNNYIYSDGFPTEIQIFSNGILTGVTKYTYENNNVNSSDNGSGVVYTYKYDDKKNPYLNKYMKYLMLYPDFTSINNIVENTKTGQKYIYTYDDEGYPVTMKSPEGTVPIYDYHFEYVVK